MAPRAFLLGSLCLLLAACGCSPSGGRTQVIKGGQCCPNMEYRVEKLRSAPPHAPLALLLHADGRQNDVWDGFAEYLVGQSYAVILPELPAASAPPPLTVLGVICMGFYFAESPPEGEAESEPAVLIGEGSGAVMALELATTQDNVRAVVLLSPLLKKDTLDALTRMKGFDRCPVLIIASEDDAASASAAMQLKDAAPAFCEVQLYPGTSKGSDIFAIRPSVMTTVSDWLALILGRQPPE